MKKIYYYLYLRNLEQGYPCVFRALNEPLPEEETEGLLMRLYCAERLPERLIIDDTDTIREPTPQEVYDLAQKFVQEYIVPSGMYVKDDVVKALPACSVTLVNPRFDVEQEVWQEMATPEQVASHVQQETRRYYLYALASYGLVRLEHELGLVSDAEMVEATAYIKGLAAEEEVIRPAWLSRYEH
ncbi:hypothetical protein ACW5XW_03005 [Aeromonas piscicola]|uniref:hypothetical protein n=1 Tax=Aeromonas piscicola TaxID=600645 RepID=UPI0005B46803|nr:hypothetical protein [Aeromonas piscicola]